MERIIPIRDTTILWKALAALIILSACGYLLYHCLGVLLGTYRHDDMFFLHHSWCDFKGYQHDCVITGFFLRLLKSYWVLVNGDISTAWGYRIFILLFAMLQAVIVFKMTEYILPKKMSGKWMLQSLFACVFIVVMCSYRGYELRPEFLPNTMLLFAALVMFRLVDSEFPSRWDGVLIFGAGLGLVLGASISLRHVMPSFVFFVALLMLAWEKQNIRPLFLLGILLTCAVVAAYVNLVAYNFFQTLEHASAFQEARSAFPWLKRLKTGGGTYHLYAKGGLIFIMFSMLVSSVLRSGFKNLRYRLVPFAASAIALLAYYAFLFTVDVRPFEYVRSIEWALIVAALFSLFQMLRGGPGHGNLPNVYLGMVAILITVICFESLKDLDLNRNTNEALTCLRKSSSPQEIVSMSDTELVQLMFNQSLLDQMRSRSEYCARYPEELAIVYKIKYFPIGLRGGERSILAKCPMPPGNAASMDLSRFQYIVLPKKSRMMDKLKNKYTNILINDNISVWMKKGGRLVPH